MCRNTLQDMAIWPCDEIHAVKYEEQLFLRIYVESHPVGKHDAVAIYVVPIPLERSQLLPVHFLSPPARSLQANNDQGGGQYDHVEHEGTLNEEVICFKAGESQTSVKNFLVERLD